MNVLVPDTNLFEQCRDVSALNWDALRLQGSVLLLVPRAVQGEIDRHKTDLNQRRAKRARNASSLFRQALRSPNGSVQLRAENPKVELSFPPAGLQPLPGKSLDLARTDDQVVGEALAIRDLHPEAVVSVLTQDTHLQLTARHEGLPVVEIPDEWLLEPERSDSDKRIAALENRLKALETEKPVVDFFFCDRGRRVSSVRIDVVRYERLTDPELEDLLDYAKKFAPLQKVVTTDQPPPEALKPAHPVGIEDVVRAVHMLGGKRYVPPSQQAIDQYQNRDYPDWLARLRRKLATLDSLLEDPTRTTTVRLIARNTGNAPASMCRVEFDAFERAALMRAEPDDADNDEEDEPLIPAAPVAPKGRWTNFFDDIGQAFAAPHISRFASIAPMGHIKDRDAHAFYWTDSRPITPVVSLALKCDEWRHGVEPEEFKISVVALRGDGARAGGTVRCRITAKNLPHPATINLKVDVAVSHGNTFDAAKSLLDQFLK